MISKSKVLLCVLLLYITEKRLNEIIGEWSSINFRQGRTDSPVSQFRKKVISQVAHKHKEEYNSVTSWSYFKAGHGKDPCDGVGGTTEYLADNAVKVPKT